MSDLISRSALIAEINRIGGHLYSEWETAGVLSMAERIPAVDAVAVVRCKDCDRRNKSADLTDTVYCRWFRAQMRKTDFCSYGERKEHE